MTGLVVTSIFSGIGKTFGAALDWITASAVHILIIIAVLIGFLAMWEYHEAAKWQKVAASTEAGWKASNVVWAAADTVNHGTISTCIGSLQNWSAAIRAWSASSQAKQTAAQAALNAATARGRASEALAARMDSEAALAASTGKECLDGPAVLAARSQL